MMDSKLDIENLFVYSTSYLPLKTNIVCIRQNTGYCKIYTGIILNY